ncbi:glucosamine-6-phosphate deaminase [Anseongella ginsenosidimutans]|uniref:Glucosamine-6-phosphate deaminase n=1 Tax=Anseongella ginsenosidimutans TaxID=496056 RepID=A0A4R3KR67_9SPHI|nr:glucosamine-6-phosphate deaminase [Anseongella ginsenosidimutans]QEC52207.1 glucosamine-6-phosphate deaminase [Anseongella ginsenosidimutans]TCS86755.1 glucosamine-6-phosphate deaminase [Anseongella ginsenosidimutans]
METSKVDRLQVQIYHDRKQLGAAAAGAVAGKIRGLLDQQEQVNLVFAAAPSQEEFLADLSVKDIPWNRMNAFHMDEYQGLDGDAPQGFGNFLKKRLFDKAPFNSVHYINGNAADAAAECSRYAALLERYPADIVCMGIGENCHIAFNDPHVADFNDSKLVKIVDLDRECRMQQVHDGCFPRLEEVPAYALTLTVPALMRGRFVFCIVPGKNKARAVHHTKHQPVSEKYPSTVLRTHPQAILFIDEASGGLLK